MSLQELEKTQATAAQNTSLETQNSEINLTAVKLISLFCVSRLVFCAAVA